MKSNVGNLDRLIRFAMGLLLLVLPFVPGITVFANPLAYWGALVAGVVLLVTALVRFCPLYTVFGFSSCKVSH